MTTTKTKKKRATKKRCQKCGRTSLTSARRCLHQPFGPRSYCCGGALEPVVVAVVGTDVTRYVAAARRRAAVELRRATRRAKATRTRIKRLTTALRRWEARIRRAERQAALSDAEILAVRERATSAAKQSARIQRVRRRLLGKGRRPETT